MVSFKLEATTPSSFISALSDEGKLFIFSSLLDTLRELSWHPYTRYSLASGDTWQMRQQSLSSKRFSKSAHEILRSEMVLSTLNQKACEKLLLTSLLQVPSASCRELSKSFIHYFFFPLIPICKTNFQEHMCLYHKTMDSTEACAMFIFSGEV